MALRWAALHDLDGANPYWVLTADETESRRSVSRPLNAVAAAILHEVRRERESGGRVVPLRLSEWVFPARSAAAGHVGDVDYAWRRIKEQAGLPAGFRLHDLRHSFASLAASSGETLLTVSKLLGHSSTAMTERYSHLFATVERRASEAVGELIRGGNGKP
jgi:integrase